MSRPGGDWLYWRSRWQIYSLGLQVNGSLWAWGRNIYGQLGLGDTADRNTPTRVGTALIGWRWLPDPVTAWGCNIR